MSDNRYTIWKFPIEIAKQVIQVPKGTMMLTAQMQNGDLCLWGIVDKDAPLVDRHIDVFGTGHTLTGGRHYIATVQVGPYVWHVFETRSSQDLPYCTTL